MKPKEKSTLRKIEHKKAESFYLIIRGLEVGIVAGLVTVLYRFLLNFAEKSLFSVLSFIKGKPAYCVLWIALLAAAGAGVAFLIKAVPFAGGSGIPQVSGEVKGYFAQPWHKVIIAKIIGGTAAVFSGLSLGREGPSIQFGAMAAKGIAKATKADKTTERRMISCGGGAGFAAAFNAPLAGVMFILEQFYHSFDKAVLLMGIMSAVVADYVSKLFYGQETVFNYKGTNIPLRQYWILLIFGLILGLFGVMYNIITMWYSRFFAKINKIPQAVKWALVFAISGIVGLFAPQILCGGHKMWSILVNDRPGIKILLLLLFSKFIFGVFSAGSGVPGGTLYPMLILGSYIGAAFSIGSARLFGTNPEMWQEFAVIGIAGLFSSIVRAPITGIIIAIEISGNIKNFLPIALVSLISCAVAEMTGTSPIYDSMLDDMIKKAGVKTTPNKKAEKVLVTFSVPSGSSVAGKQISNIDWGKHCLIVSIDRGDISITPKGDTQILVGDTLVIMISQRRFARDRQRLEKIIGTPKL